VFLTRCLKEKVIPNTFILPLKLLHLDQENTAKANNTLNQTSKTLLKLALRSRKKEVIHLNKSYWDAWHILFNLAQGHSKDNIKNQLQNLENKIADKFTLKSQQKFSWLLHKKQSKPRLPNPKPNPPPDTTNNIEESNKPKKKKHRRFIKRSKWQRLQVKQNKKQITAIYNHSNLELTDAMKSVLNRGLNFFVYH
jgi:hypothetical protein